MAEEAQAETEETIQPAQPDDASEGVPSDYLGLTQEEIDREEEFMRGIPRFNLAAFLMPPFWGPAHGVWATILYYPVWVWLDNCIYGAYTVGTPGTIAIAVIMVLSYIVVTLMFSLVAGPMSAHRAAEQGVAKKSYIKRQRIWAVVCVLLAVVFLALATYYNLNLR